MPPWVPPAIKKFGTTSPGPEGLARWAETLLSFIQRYPGVYLREVVRRLGIPMGTLHYHLKRQIANGLVESRDIGGHRCLFPCRPPVGGAPLTPPEKNTLAMLRRRIPRMVMLHLLDFGPCTGSRLVGDLYVSPSHLAYYLDRLETLGLILRGQDTLGHRTAQLASPDDVRKVLLTYPPLREGPGDRWLDLWEEMRL